MTRAVTWTVVAMCVAVCCAADLPPLPKAKCPDPATLEINAGRAIKFENPLPHLMRGSGFSNGMRQEALIFNSNGFGHFGIVRAASRAASTDACRHFPAISSAADTIVSSDAAAIATIRFLIITSAFIRLPCML